MDFNSLIQQGTAHAWLYIPVAIVLGALHGLEPGHSKTMMAAFIIAIRGTVAQALLLGLSAAFSHSLVIWILAASALHYSSQWNPETSEPYFQMASGVIIIGLAVWMFVRTRRDQIAAFRHAHEHHHHHDHDHDHGHNHVHGEHGDYEDAHQKAHAADIMKRFSNRQVTTGQIILFGLTGGLLPCPAAVTILLVCLQLKEVTLGFALVFSFSVGLAMTLMAVGAVGAWGMRHASRLLKNFDVWARKAPYFSSAVLTVLGTYIAIHGWRSL